MPGLPIDESLPEEGPPSEFDVYSVIHLLRPDIRPELTEDETRRVMRQHLAYTSRLHAEGHTIAHGPLGDDPDRRVRAMAIFRAGPGDATRLAEADPAVRHGLFTIDVVRWHMAKGALADGIARTP